MVNRVRNAVRYRIILHLFFCRFARYGSFFLIFFFLQQFYASFSSLFLNIFANGKVLTQIPIHYCMEQLKQSLIDSCSSEQKFFASVYVFVQGFFPVTGYISQSLTVESSHKKVKIKHPSRKLLEPVAKFWHFWVCVTVYVCVSFIKYSIW